MNTIDDPRFDQSELDRLLSQFEKSGPAVPEGVDDFCEAFELWIDEGAADDKQVDGFRADPLFIRGMLDTARGDYACAIEHLPSVPRRIRWLHRHDRPAELARSARDLKTVPRGIVIANVGH